jgi:hypothetical protein
MATKPAPNDPMLKEMQALEEIAAKLLKKAKGE